MIELNFPEPVTSEQAFYDRHAELAKIERAFRLRETRSVIIQGDRRIGKTSFQTIAAKHLARHASLDIVPLMLPFGPTMRSVEDLALEILHALCAHLDCNPRDTGLFDDEDRFHLPSVGQYWQEIERLLAAATGRTFLVCIDEFDSLLRSCPSSEQQSQVLNLLQDLIERRSDLPLELLLSMTSLTFAGTEIDLPGSPLVSKSEVIELACFSRADMDQMVQSLLASCSEVQEGALARLFALSGGHPYVTKLLLENLLAPCDYEPQGLVVDGPAVEEAVAGAADDPRARSALTNLYEVHFGDREKALLLLLAEREVRNEARLTRRELRVLGPDYVTAGESLARRGYLERSAGALSSDDDVYALQIGFLAHWLRRWERYESETERHLREVRPRLRRLSDPWAGVEPTVVTEEDLRKFGLQP